jgi:hypothetical protein
MFFLVKTNIGILMCCMVGQVMLELGADELRDTIYTR